MASHGITPHVFRVKTLYRKLLKSYFNWFGLSRPTYLARAHQLRQQFEKYRNLSDQQAIESILQKAEAFEVQYRHPETYKSLTQPGGTMFQRNVPPPKETLLPGRPYPPMS